MTTVESQITPRATRTARILDVYLIDTGWNAKAKNVLQENMDLLESFLAGHHFYVLSRQQSREVVKQNSQYIGKDPLLVVVDSDARVEKHPHGFGFRVCFGALKHKEIRSHLGAVLQIICDRDASGAEMLERVRREAQREGPSGLIEIVGDAVCPAIANGK